LDTKILIETLISKVEELQSINTVLMKRISFLEEELAIYKNKKNSNNSSIAPSKDENRPLRNQSLRQKSDKRAGGQPGHEGKTLECSAVIDTIVEHVPGFCNCCGKDLFDVPETLMETRQFIDIPVIRPVCIEHRVYRKTCTCGYNTESNFPSNLTAKVQYGPNVESLTGYLHARQYLPYQRMKEFFTDVMCLPLSVGGINNILKRLTQKALPHYEQIKDRISKSIFVGTDETGVKVNGEKDWIWTWQNDDLTFITHSDNRGFKTIKDNFAKGLPNTILLHDRFACHFNCEAMHHQICMSHVLRDLQYIVELYPKGQWATEMKTLIVQALELKKRLAVQQYYGVSHEREKLQEKLLNLLQTTLDPAYKKAKTFQKSLLKHQQYILYFLYHPKIPPDNNGSERAIRNVKVKQKISGQFKSDEGADTFAILRSVIDTTIKSGQNVLHALSLIAKLGTE
jgi:transposase